MLRNKLNIMGGSVKKYVTGISYTSFSLGDFIT